MEFNEIQSPSSDGIIHWQCGLWSRAGIPHGDKIFTVLNEYWAKLPKENVKAFEQIYYEIHEYFDDVLCGKGLSADNTVLELRSYVKRLFVLFGDFELFRNWCVAIGRVYLENGIKDDYGPEDKIDLTYLTNEYTDLVTYSVMLKTVMPIWGQFEQMFKSVVGSNHIHLRIFDIIDIPENTDLDPYTRLTHYVESYSMDRIRDTSSSLMTGISPDQIPTYLTSLALIKKIIIFDPRDTSRSIVTNMYHLLNERCNDVIKQQPKPFKTGNDDDNDTTISDAYRSRPMLNPAHTVMYEEYLTDPISVLKSIEPNADPGRYEYYYSRFSVRNKINLNLCASIVGAVVKKVMSPKMIMILKFEDNHKLICIAATVLEYWGFDLLANVITSTPREKEYDTITLSSATARSFNLLTKELSTELNSIYPHFETPKSPGHLAIDSILRTLQLNEWDIPNSELCDFRNALARLFIRTGRD